MKQKEKKLDKKEILFILTESIFSLFMQRISSQLNLVLN